MITTPTVSQLRSAQPALSTDLFHNNFTVINLLKEEQFTSGFVAINPNSKIPALVDKEGPDGAPIHLFESASIMIYLAEKYGRFLPADTRLKAETMNWLFWQMAGLGPMCGNFGHFFVYAPQNKLEARDYGVARYGMEVQRLLSVLDQHLEGRSYLVGEELTIADFAVFPWVQALSLAFKHPSGVDGFEFLSVSKYVNVLTWYESIVQRPAVQRGIIVCTDGVSKPWLNSK